MTRPATHLEHDVTEIASGDHPPYRVGEPVWCDGYPGIVSQVDAIPGMIDVRLDRGTATVDPLDSRTVQRRDVLSPLRLGQRSDEVVRRGKPGHDLLGPRGARYTLIQNRADPDAWALIPGGSMRPRVTQYRRRPDGTFSPA